MVSRPVARIVRSSTRYAPLARAAGRVVGYGIRKYFNSKPRAAATRRTMAPRSAPSIPISQYHENRTIYKRRKMPRYKKRRWVRFKKRVQAVSWGANKKNVMYHKDAYDSSWANDAIGVCDVMMYTGYNTGNTAFQDMLRCMQVAAQSTTTSSLLQRILVKSARMFITITNSSSTSQVYLDAYWVYCTKDNTDAPADLMKVGLSTTAVVEAGGSTVLGTEETSAVGTNKGVTSFGANPFMSKVLCQHYKIYKVTKHLLSPGTSIEFTMSSPRNKFIAQPTQDYGEANTSLKGKTKGVLLVSYGPPNAAAGTAGQYGAGGSIYVRREVQYTFHPVDVGSKEFIVDN